MFEQHQHLSLIAQAGITVATVKPPTVLRTIANTTSINIANG
ncbi:hypothetical protein R2R32_12335 [Clostridium perfringens]|nr:hypothetical protein [Clostridium perfringens]